MQHLNNMNYVHSTTVFGMAHWFFCESVTYWNLIYIQLPLALRIKMCKRKACAFACAHNCAIFNIIIVICVSIFLFFAPKNSLKRIKSNIISHFNLIQINWFWRKVFARVSAAHVIANQLTNGCFGHAFLYILLLLLATFQSYHIM